MNVAFRFSATAQRHIRRAFDHFDRVRPGHGDEFRYELEAVLANIAQHPEQYQTLNLRYRRAVIERFQHVVVYHFDDQSVLVVGVLPTRIDPSLLGRLTSR